MGVADFNHVAGKEPPIDTPRILERSLRIQTEWERSSHLDAKFFAGFDRSAVYNGAPFSSSFLQLHCPVGELP